MLSLLFPHTFPILSYLSHLFKPSQATETSASPPGDELSLDLGRKPSLGFLLQCGAAVSTAGAVPSGASWLLLALQSSGSGGISHSQSLVTKSQPEMVLLLLLQETKTGRDGR